MNRDQKRYLEDRVEQLARLRWDHPPETEPATVKRARAVIDAFEKSVRKRQEARSKTITEQMKAIRREIAFGDAKKALALVEKAEATFE